MKCIVMQVEKGRAVLLDSKGNFKTVRNNGYRIGQTIRHNTALKNIYALAASVIVFIGLGVCGYKMYYTPVSYLSIEINPSIQLSINMFDRVIGYEYFNDEGKEILNDAGLKNEKSKESVEKIIEQARVRGYLNIENNNVLIDVVEKNNALIDKLTPLCADYAPKNIDIVIECASDEEVKIAKEKNVSIAMAKAVKEYSEFYGGSVEDNIEELRYVPVKKVKERNIQDTQKEPEKTEEKKTEIIVNESEKQDKKTIPVKNSSVVRSNNTYLPKQTDIKPVAVPEPETIVAEPEYIIVTAPAFEVLPSFNHDDYREEIGKESDLAESAETEEKRNEINSDSDDNEKENIKTLGNTDLIDCEQAENQTKNEIQNDVRNDKADDDRYVSPQKDSSENHNDISESSENRGIDTAVSNEKYDKHENDTDSKNSDSSPKKSDSSSRSESKSSSGNSSAVSSSGADNGASSSANNGASNGGTGSHSEKGAKFSSGSAVSSYSNDSGNKSSDKSTSSSGESSKNSNNSDRNDSGKTGKESRGSQSHQEKGKNTSDKGSRK